MLRTSAGILLLALTASACASTAVPLQPRSVVILSGERIPPDADRMAGVEAWLRPQLEEIERNPSFVIAVRAQDAAGYPWDTFVLEGDTARVFFESTAADAETAYLLYAHFRLIAERGELEPWLPEAVGEDAYGVERAILRRVAEVWLLGRSVFDTQAHGPLEELLYAAEYGFLDDFLLATQGGRFEAERDRWAAENPERGDQFRSWFVQTFEREGPGFIPSGSSAM